MPRQDPPAIPSAHKSLLNSPIGLGQRNRVTSNHGRSQTSYRRCPGSVQRGGTAPLSCAPLGASRACTLNWEFLEGPTGAKTGGPETQNLEVPWRPQDRDPSTHGPGSSRPQATGAAAASAARCGRAAAAHWCGTTIGTSLRFCLQSNPAIKRGTKSPLITPCHKVICPGGKP